MKAVTLSPIEAWALAEGHTLRMVYGRRSFYRGDLLIGARALTEVDAESYVNFYRRRADSALPHPAAFGGAFSTGAYIALGKLVKVVPSKVVQLTEVEHLLLPNKRWLYVFEEVVKLKKPLVCTQDSGIRDYDLDHLRPRRYPLNAEQVAALYRLCEQVEALNNHRLASAQLLDGHFITFPAHEKLRRRLFRADHGRFLLRRALWRKALAEAFPDYRAEAVHADE